MLSSIGDSSVKLEYGSQDIPLPCPRVLPSAPLVPLEAPPLIDGTIELDSWAVVISESVVMTVQMAARNDWTDAFCRKRSQYLEFVSRRL